MKDNYEGRGMTASEFKRILEVQEKQLKEWKSVLKPEIYEKLEANALAKNEHVFNAFDIFRGNDMNMYIQNVLMTRV